MLSIYFEGTRTYTYRKRPRVAFLHTVLRWAKNKDILLFIEVSVDYFFISYRTEVDSPMALTCRGVFKS